MHACMHTQRLTPPHAQWQTDAPHKDRHEPAHKERYVQTNYRQFSRLQGKGASQTCRAERVRPAGVVVQRRFQACPGFGGNDRNVPTAVSTCTSQTPSLPRSCRSSHTPHLYFVGPNWVSMVVCESLPVTGHFSSECKRGPEVAEEHTGTAKPQEERQLRNKQLVNEETFNKHAGSLEKQT